MESVLSDTHVRGIRKHECTEAARRLMNRALRLASGCPPARRGRWRTYWIKGLQAMSGELSVHTFKGGGRHPVIVHLMLEPLPMTAGPQGFVLVGIKLDYRVGSPEPMVLPVRVTAHALERLTSRASGRKCADWIRELRTALLALYFISTDAELITRLMEHGPGERFHIATQTGYARVIHSDGQLLLVTWLHEVDLGRTQAYEAAMQDADINAYLKSILKPPLELAAARWPDLMKLL